MKRTVIITAMLAVTAAACGTGEVGSAGSVTTAPPDDAATTTTTTATTAAGTEPTVPTTPPPAETGTAAGPDQVFVELFFISEDLTAEPVLHAVDSPNVAAGAMRALIAGPTAAEADAGLSTAIPADTLLLDLTIADGLATVDLSREFEVGGGSMNILSRLAQVVYTLTQFPTVNQVLFYLDGEPVEVFSGEGVVLGDAVDRGDYATILPLSPVPVPGAPELWTQEELPGIAGADPTALSRVALVTDDDVLNVREDPNVAAPIVGMLQPGVVVERTGQEELTGSSIWAQIKTPIGEFWVNSWFLTPLVSATEFATDGRIDQLLDALAAIIADDGDLRQVTGRRGLFVSHHGDPIRFARDDLRAVLTDPTTYHWPSNAVAPEHLHEIPALTFADAIADSFVSAYDDPDTVTTRNQPITGGNGRLPDAAIPFSLQAFNYAGVHDPGDVPAYDGLDWVTWYVSIDYEDGAPIVVGLTIDNWAP